MVATQTHEWEMNPPYKCQLCGWHIDTQPALKIGGYVLCSNCAEEQMVAAGMPLVGLRGLALRDGVDVKDTEEGTPKLAHSYNPEERAISLSWGEVEQIVASYLTKHGIDPALLKQEQADDLMESAKDALEWGTDGFWEETINAGLSDILASNYLAKREEDPSCLLTKEDVDNALQFAIDAYKEEK